MREKCTNGEHDGIKPQRVGHSKDPCVRPRQKIPRLKSLPPTMQPIEVSDVVGNKDR